METKRKIKQFFISLGRRIKANFGWKSALFAGICIILLAADLLTKHFAEADGWRFTIIPKFLEIVDVVHNDGASLGMGGGTNWALPLFITLTFIMVPVFIAVILLLPERFTLLKLCLYMATAGALGNLVDRLAFGYVRDFIGMDWGFVSYVCNLADVWLMVGLVLAIIDMLFLNEISVFPLTKSARAAQAERKKREEEKAAVAQPSNGSAEVSKASEDAGANQSAQKNDTDQNAQKDGAEQNTCGLSDGERDGR